MLSPLCVRLMLSDIVGATSITTNLDIPSRCCFCGIVFVTYKSNLFIHFLNEYMKHVLQVCLSAENLAVQGLFPRVSL